MNKSEFISAISETSGLSKAEAGKALDATLEVITDTLKKKEPITLVGFGTFLSRHREARVGRNPKTGEAIQIKASNMPSFKAGKGLKDAIN